MPGKVWKHVLHSVLCQIKSSFPESVPGLSLFVCIVCLRMNCCITSNKTCHRVSLEVSTTFQCIVQ